MIEKNFQYYFKKIFFNHLKKIIKKDFFKIIFKINCKVILVILIHVNHMLIDEWFMNGILG